MMGTRSDSVMNYVNRAERRRAGNTTTSSRGTTIAQLVGITTAISAAMMIILQTRIF